MAVEGQRDPVAAASTTATHDAPASSTQLEAGSPSTPVATAPEQLPPAARDSSALSSAKPMGSSSSTAGRGSSPQPQLSASSASQLQTPFSQLPGPSSAAQLRDSLPTATSPAPPADPQLDPATLHELLHLMATPSDSQVRFTAEEITQSEHLVAAARAEYEALHTRDALQPEGPMQSAAHELPRQQEAVESVDQNVEEESKVNVEVAQLVVQRLVVGRSSLEGLARVLQGLVSAEAAYSSAMASVARSINPHGGPGGASHSGRRSSNSSSGGTTSSTGVGTTTTGWTTGPPAVSAAAAADDPVRALLGALAALPDTVGQSHRHLQGSLASLLVDVQKLYDAYADGCKRATAEATAVQAGVTKARLALSNAFGTHAFVCTSFDGILRERSRGQHKKGPDADPWATEGSLTREHGTLQRAQAAERAFLKRSFQQVQELEARRLELSKQAAAVTAGSYRAALLPIQHDLVSLMEAAQGTDTDTRLGKLANAATVATEIAEKLSEQQERAMEAVCQELFASPEIIRQGEMQYLDAPFSRWTAGHFVLTRAGFLHWFKSGDQVEPLGVLSLGRCQFEAGTAYCFHVMDVKPSGWLVGARHHRYSFQAPSVDDCCEWVVAIREAIEVAGGRALHYDEGAAAAAN